MRKHLRSIIAILISILLFGAADAAAEKRDSLVVSLVTCWPGSEVYELCGHSALRMRNADGSEDFAWNYGLFDYTEPHFVYRFVKGETDYMMGPIPFDLFAAEYARQGRRVLEQELNLTNDEALRLRALLLEESRPENRTYRYNYVRDNCATRITDRLSQALGQFIVFPDTLSFGTFRDEMRSFHRNYPWYQFGIDLALGSGLDYKLRPNEEMFTPIVMSERYAGAHLADGRQLVRATRELVPDSGHATLGPTPFYAAPTGVSIAVLVAIGALCAWMLWRRRMLRWVFALWFAVLGTAGCIIAFLVFVSQHEATSPNMLIVWLNPLQLLPLFTIWSRRTRWITTAMAWYNLAAVGILLILWPFQQQSANTAFFPLMAATLLLALTYAILTAKKSYNIDRTYHNISKHEKVGSHDDGGAGRTGGRRGSGVRKQAPARGRNSR